MQNDASLFSKTLSEKMQFVRTFEESNKFLSSPNEFEQSSFEKSKNNEKTHVISGIAQKYEDFSLSSPGFLPEKVLGEDNNDYISEETMNFYLLLKKFEDPHQPNQITIGNICNFLFEIGVFVECSGAELKKQEDFFQNLVGIMSLPENPLEILPLAQVSQVFHVFFEEKLQISRAARQLQSILEQNLINSGVSEDFNFVREEKGLWSLEKLIIEFRKLIDSEESVPNLSISNKPLEETSKERKSNDERQGFSSKNSKSESVSNEGKKETIRKNYKTRYEMLFDHAKYLKEKKEMKNALKYIEDLQQYSFKPKIKDFQKSSNTSNNKTNKTNNYRNGTKNNETTNNNGEIFTTNSNCYDRLYNISKRKAERIEKSDELKKKQEKEDIECTFRPKINKYDKLYSSNPTTLQTSVKGYEESIKRIVEARQEKEKIMKLYEEPLLRFQKNKKYIEQRDTNYTVPAPFNFTQSPNREKDLLMFVDVEVAPGKIGRVGICKGDNIEEVAKNFARIYTLNKDMEKKLVGNLKKKFENYQKATNFLI